MAFPDVKCLADMDIQARLHKIFASPVSRVNSALGGPAGWLLILLSISVLTVSFERIRFWTIWWKRRRTLQQRWLEAVSLGSEAALAFMEERDMEMGFAQSFLEAACVIAPLVGLIGTVFGVSRLLSAMGPQLLLPPDTGLAGFGEALSSTGMGLLISLVATVTQHANNGLRQWQLSLWRRDLRGRELPRVT